MDYTPDRGRIDAVVCGNHEYHREPGTGAIMREIVRDLGCEEAYLGAQGWLVYQFS